MVKGERWYMHHTPLLELNCICFGGGGGGGGYYFNKISLLEKVESPCSISSIFTLCQMLKLFNLVINQHILKYCYGTHFTHAYPLYNMWFVNAVSPLQ